MKRIIIIAVLIVGMIVPAASAGTERAPWVFTHTCDVCDEATKAEECTIPDKWIKVQLNEHLAGTSNYGDMYAWDEIIICDKCCQKPCAVGRAILKASGVDVLSVTQNLDHAIITIPKEESEQPNVCGTEIKVDKCDCCAQALPSPHWKHDGFPGKRFCSKGCGEQFVNDVWWDLHTSHPVYTYTEAEGKYLHNVEKEEPEDDALPYSGDLYEPDVPWR